MATEPIVRQTSRINFGIYTADEIRKLSVKRITNPVLLDDTNLPTKGGLYDPALGATSPHEKCVTCSLSYFHCPGHPGHIELVLPVYNPILFDSLFQVLRTKCFYCDRLKLGRLSVEVFLARIKLLEYGLLEEAMDLDPATLFAEDGEAEEVMQVDGETDGGKKASKTKSITKQLEESHIGMVNEYVKRALRNAGKKGPVTQDELDQRTTNTNNYHTQLIKEFLALGARCNRCLNCEAPSRSFKKNGVGKIFLMSLPNKQADKLRGMGINPEGNDPFDMPEGIVEVDGEEEEGGRKKKKGEGKKKDGKKGKKDGQDTFIDDQAEETDGEGETEDDGENGEEGGEGEEEEDEFAKQGERIQARGEAERKAQVAVSARYLTPQVVREYIRKLFAMDYRALAMIFGRSKRGKDGTIERVASYDMFFLDVLPVPPSRFRPANKVGDMLMESPQNVYLGNVLKQNVLLLDMIQQMNAAADASMNGIGEEKGEKGKKEKGKGKEKTKDTAQGAVRKVDMVKVQAAWSQMQTSVNGLMDSATLGAAAKRMPAGIKQMLEKKQGLFRMHMMGKRVNYACRSVISPDPYIGTHEMGIPMVFATKLTFPEPVTPYNLHEMREAVANGPNVHPGATLVEHEDGRVTSLAALTVEQRQALASQLLTPPEGGRTRHMLGKKVHRHIRTGDVVLANRQPTLHKPSIMAHKVRVLPGEKTLRMHYANCNTYNADFDGDEMNVHFPQSQQARAEAYNIANTDNQYLVPTSGKPLRGLIQDHVASGSVLTARTTLMDRTRYQQLVFTALPDLPGRVRTLPPCIIKPKEMWSGKQVVSTILLNVCMEGRSDAEALHLDSQAKIPSSLWGEKSEEGNVIFRHGELLCGVLDKSQFGATSYGLVHACYELYGPEAAGKLLTALGRLFTAYLQFRGLTCGIDDLLLTPAGDEERRKLLKEADTAGAEQVAAFMGQPDMAKDVEYLKDGLKDIYRSDEKMAGLDATMKTRLNQLTSNVINACLPGAAQKPFPENNLSLMIQSGAKGSSVNSSQISCLLGQQELEGRRVPVMVSGRSLPSFLPYDTSARSGGYVRGRFLTGIKPQEYFFHCMAGREGLIDTAVKTARSGYLQRCLIKHLEGLRVHYDMTVRDTDGSCVQFAYGEDGCDVTRTAFLEKFEFLNKNEAALQGKLKPQEAVQHMNYTKATKLFRKVKKSISKTPDSPLDPVLGSLRPDLYLGATSERFHKNLEKHVESGKMREEVEKDAFRLLMWLKYRASLAEPGEAVGLLAAQGVGEPSTQMTLNTFHFAGFGAMNVTLGIPRLREILMTASEKIKTPAMTIPLLPNVKNPTQRAEKLRHRFTRLTLSDVVSSVAVKEWLEAPKTGGVQSKKGDKHMPAHGPVRKYHVRIEMDREVVASKEVMLTTSELRRGLENQLLPLLNRAVATHIKGKKANSAATVHSLSKARKDADAEGGNDDEGVDMDEDEEKPKRKSRDWDEPAAEGDDENEDEDDDNEDGDATDAKNRGKRKERSTYSESESEGEEEEEEEEGENGVEGGDREDGNEEDGNEGEDSKEGKKTKKGEKVKEERVTKEDIVAGLLGRFAPYLVQYDYDDVNSQWAEFTLSISGSARKLLLVSLIENLAEKCVVRSIPGIRRALIADPEPSKPNAPVTIQTEGSNVREVWNHGMYFDVNKIYTNDIVMILKTYGVEAARAAIMREVASVFKVYGIGVDMRHLSLIADYMTFEGGYKPFNRIGIDSNPSPLAKMTFETTMKFMKSAVLTGDFDSLRSPSARIVLGRVVEAGTGCVDMLQPLAPTH